MKKISLITIAICILVLISCGKEKNYTIEVKDGVEIIKNKNIESSPDLQLNLKIISEISLDKLVLPDSIPTIESFYMTALDFDSNIYISDFRRSVVYKVDKNGNYVANFNRKGQGPGESLAINDIIIIRDSVYVFGESGKTMIYTRSGDFIRQFRLFDGKYSNLQIMNSESKIVCNSRNIVPDYKNKKALIKLGVYLLDSNNLENSSKILEISTTTDLNNYRYRMSDDQRKFCLYNGQVYVEDLSFSYYAVDVYDLNGNKIRRIEKQTRRIACSDELKKKVHEIDLGNTMVKFVADYMKQILNMYVDKNGYLWIKPAVEGLEFDHQFFDIFNSDGVFMKRIKLPLSDSFGLLVFDKNKLIAVDRDNCIVKVFDYEFL